MGTLRTFAIRATLVIGVAATLLPSAALAASDVYGLVAPDGGMSTFGSVDLATGTYSQIGGTNGLPFGYYAPVFDPARNSFFVLSSPFGNPVFSNSFTEINAATGGVTQIDVTSGPGMGGLRPVLGFGVNPASSQLYGLVNSLGGVGPTDFGTIDPLTGDFTQIGGPTGLSLGNYAPVFDPARNSFFVPFQPIAPSTFSNTVSEIDAATGGVVSIDVTQGGSGPGHGRAVLGLGVDPASNQLYGLVHSGSDVVFGKIDPATGDFTQIGGPTGLPVGYYAPVFDPQSGDFLVTVEPIPGNTFAEVMGEIDPSTGVLTSTLLGLVPPNPDVNLILLGLGVASSPTAAVPEPSTWAMMLIGFAGLAFAACRRTNRDRVVHAA
jgi:hypothetical protein